MKITKSQLKQLIKEELSNITEGGAGLADRLMGWWEMLQNDPGFMELGRDPTDKFGGRR